MNLDLLLDVVMLFAPWAVTTLACSLFLAAVGYLHLRGFFGSAHPEVASLDDLVDRDGRWHGVWRGRPVFVSRKGARLTVSVEVPGLRWTLGEGDEPTASKVGDETFDRRFSVDFGRTDPALLRRDLREDLLALAQHGRVSCRHDTLRTTSTWSDLAALHHLLDEVAAVADDAAATEPLAPAIDPHEVEKLRVRVFRSHRHAMTEHAGAALLESDLPYFRWWTAIHLRNDEALVRCLLDGVVPETQRADAMQAISEAGSPAAVGRLLAEGDADVQEAAAALASERPSLDMARQTFTWWTERRAAHVRPWHGSALGDAVTSHLVACWVAAELPEAQPLLFDALMWPLTDDCRSQVLDALGAHGGVDLVAKLREVRPRLPRPAGRRVEEVVERIQARAGGEQGGLAVVAAAPEEGAVSLAAQAGRLSQPERS